MLNRQWKTPPLNLTLQLIINTIKYQEEVILLYQLHQLINYYYDKLLNLLLLLILE